RTLALLTASGLGGLVEQLGAVPLRAIHVAAQKRRAVLPLPQGRAVGREAFDAALVRAAVHAGAAFLPETHATLEGLQNAVRTARLRQGEQGQTVATRLVLVAAGLAASWEVAARAAGW